MKSSFTIPKDLPAAACGRCMWWKQTDSEGWGNCLLQRGRKYWYQCMVCVEYELDPSVRP